MDQLKTAMATQTVIGQARGILIERHKLTAGQAFDRLRTARMNLNRKLRDVAKDLSETCEDTALTPRRAVSGGEAARMKELARYDILDTTPDGGSDGHHLGTVAVMDTQPPQPTPQQVEMLADLAAVVMDDLELRLLAINALRDRSPARFQP